MEQRYLLDTNTVIDFAAQSLPSENQKIIANILDEAPIISVINKIELLGFSNVPHVISIFIESVNVIPLSDAIVSATIEIRKKHKTKLPDAIIAATAIVHDLVLVSRNVDDFKRIESLVLFNPHQSNS